MGGGKWIGGSRARGFRSEERENGLLTKMVRGARLVGPFRFGIRKRCTERCRRLYVWDLCSGQVRKFESLMRKCPYELCHHGLLNKIRFIWFAFLLVPSLKIFLLSPDVDGIPALFFCSDILLIRDLRKVHSERCRHALLTAHTQNRSRQDNEPDNRSS